MRYLMIALLFVIGCSQPKNLTLMPLGDSITYGAGSISTNGYRKDLSTYLLDVIFVGSETNGDFTQNHHEGHPGYVILGRESEGTLGIGLYENVPEWLHLTKPDIMCLLIGTNSLARGLNLGPQAIANRSIQDLTLLLLRIHMYMPNAAIYVGSVTNIQQDMPWPGGPTDPSVRMAFQEAINAYNAQLPGLIASLQNEINVRFVDINASIPNIPNNYYDMVHPNSNGYALMASMWAKSILQK